MVGTLGSLLLAVGCAGPAATATQAPAAPPAPNAAPAAPAAPIRVTLASAAVSLGMAPILVARSKSFFAEEGIDLDWQLLQGAPMVAAGVSSGDVQLGNGSAADVIGLSARNVPVLAVEAHTQKMLFDVIARRDLARERGLSPDLPLRDRIVGLHGARMGVTSAGGPPDRYWRWLTTQGGFAPDDVETVRVGSPPEIRTAFRQGQIDGTLSTPPAGPQLEQEGIGIVLIRNRDVPEFGQFPHDALYATRSYAEEHPDAITRAARAIGRGSALIQGNTAEAQALLRPEFKDVDPALVDRSVELVKDAFSTDGRMTEEVWQNAMTVLVGSGAIFRALDTREGGLWTNRYLP